MTGEGQEGLDIVSFCVTGEGQEGLDIASLRMTREVQECLDIVNLRNHMVSSSLKWPCSVKIAFYRSLLLYSFFSREATLIIEAVPSTDPEDSWTAVYRFNRRFSASGLTEAVLKINECLKVIMVTVIIYTGNAVNSV